MPIIVTDNIERECNNLISLFKDTKYIRSILLKNYPRLSDTKQRNLPGKIKSLVSQGIEFLNETDEQILTAPLTLFYSMYNFAKAIFYINRPNESIANSHGLDFDNKSAEEADELGDICVKMTQKGAFANLVSITGDSITSNDVLCAKEVFSVIPELCDVFALRYMEEPNVFLLREKKNVPYSFEVLHQTENWFEGKDFSLAGSKNLHVMNSTWNTTLMRTEACSQEDFDSVTYRDAYGNLYLTCGIETENSRCKLSRISALYLCYYIFSMLVRYYPEKWGGFCDSADSTIIQKLIIHSRKEMLMEVLKLLSGKEYSFVTKLQLLEPELDVRELWKKIEHEIRLQKRISGRSPIQSLL